MRFTIRVAIDRTGAAPVGRLTLESAALGPVAPREVRLVDDGAGGLMPVPPEIPAAGEPHAALCQGDAEAFRAALNDFRGRRTASASTFGRYLLTVLLGRAWWPAIRGVARPAGDTLVELALTWPSEPDLLPFERLPWEVLAEGAQPLVALDDPRVAITRVITKPAARDALPRLDPLDLPPRVLFVVGTTLRNPKIRAASEILSILNGVDTPDRSIHATLLEEASPKQVREAVRNERPQVVHFICHGDVENGEGWLELQNDEKGKKPVACRSGDLLAMLRPNAAAAPPIVVLGACRSAGPVDFTPAEPVPPPDELAAMPGRPVAMASLGARLVAGGVPIVIGMSGRVSDVAARLFTQRFQASVLGGEPLVSATAFARRAPFLAGAAGNGSIDWAYPSVLLDESVDPMYTPTPAVGPAGPDTLTTWVKSFDGGNTKRPIFCHRHEFVADFDRLFRGSGAGMLVVHTKADARQADARWGRTRLLEQFAFRTLRNGHLPLLVAPPRPNPPRTLVEIVELLDKQLGFDARELNLGAPDLMMRILRNAVARDGVTPAAADRAIPAVTAAAAAAKADAAKTPGSARLALRSQRAIELQQELGGVVRPQAVWLALTVDLLTLASLFENRLAAFRADVVAAGRTVPPWLATPEAARPVLILDNLDLFEKDAVDVLFDQVNQGGLGSAASPIPVIASAHIDAAPTALSITSKMEERSAHVIARPLASFPDGDAMLVYESVLLHPFDDDLFRFKELDFTSAMPLAPSGAVPANVDSIVRSFFAMMVGGRPDRLYEHLYQAAVMGLREKYFIVADDTATLRGLGVRP